ncbi:MAG: phosphonate C-P lyase system protein PhnH [Spirochaetaceae bacterium]|jgi:alpha-D-ribose 1-methylphosphonate 5-triphosphate synthase subunit PhnH|nr:phosphonate C-P lyase system protein PhnH [Spirochaetaceae bacterium]
MKTKHSFDTVHGSQEVFRILLEALSNPGRIMDLGSREDQFAARGRWLALALTLLDNETGFFWDGDAETGEEIRFLTGAAALPPAEADFVFLPAPAEGPPGPAGVEAARFLSQVKQGTHIDPHNSAILFIAANERYAAENNGDEKNNGEKPGEALYLTGPGIPPQGRRIDLSPAEAAWRRARDERGFEYPCGVELVFLREDRSLLALTRKTMIGP